MSEFLEPANGNKSAKDVLTNPKRNLAEDALKPIVFMLKESGVPNATIADVLFKHLLLAAVPSGEIDGRAIHAYLGQLMRFKGELEDRINEIIGPHQNTHN